MSKEFQTAQDGAVGCFWGIGSITIEVLTHKIPQRFFLVLIWFEGNRVSELCSMYVWRCGQEI